MEANIIFENVKAYNVTKFDVRLGESFSIELIDPAGDIRWFADQDSVLDISVDDTGNTATLIATAKGKSEIQLQSSGTVVKTLFVEVYDNIAVNLNLSAKPPILKTTKK